MNYYYFAKMALNLDWGRNLFLKLLYLLQFHFLHFRHLQGVAVISDIDEFDDGAVSADEFPFGVASADFLDGIGLDGVAAVVGERDGLP